MVGRSISAQWSCDESSPLVEDLEKVLTDQYYFLQILESGDDSIDRILSQ